MHRNDTRRNWLFRAAASFCALATGCITPGTPYQPYTAGIVASNPYASVANPNCCPPAQSPLNPVPGPGDYAPTPAGPIPVTPGDPSPAQPIPGGTAPSPAGRIALRTTGPAQASSGATLTYRIQVSNVDAGTADEVTVTVDLPAGLSHLNSVPEAEGSGDSLQWSIGALNPGETRVIEANFRADQQGTVNLCASAETGEGDRAQSCVSTAVSVASLEITMSGPERAQRGQDVTFEINIVNRGAVLATGLTMRDSFDPGLEHAASGSTGPLERTLNDLAPGASQRVGVTFRVAAEGRLCNRVELRAQGGAVSSAEACVLVEAPAEPARPSVAIVSRGPRRQQTGGMAEFEIELTNDGNVPLTAVTVTDIYAAELDPAFATDGWRFDEEDRLVWTFGTLAPGEVRLLQLHCRCLQSAIQACNRVVVTTREGARDEAEACLDIIASQSNLDLTVSELQDPVRVGKTVTYEIRVTNRGDTADRKLTLTALLPQGMAFVPLGSTGPDGSRPFVPQGQTVEFEPVAQINAAETLTYRMVLRAEQPGRSLLRLTLASEGLGQPITVEEDTTVNAAP